MWWDWTAITLWDSVLFSLVSIVTLYFVGSGILRLISFLNKKTDPFSSFDFLVKTNFRIIFGFVFIFLFVFIFSIFNVPFLVSTVLIIIIAIIGFVATRHSFKLRLPQKIHLKSYVPAITVLLVLLTIIFVSSTLIVGFYGSTNDDGADHTLMVRILLQNPNALLTRSAQPYANFPLNYPSGTHVLCAFFVSLLNVPVQKIIILVSVIFPSLIALSFYSTIKCLFKNKVLSILGLMIAAFFTIGLSWAPISWGDLPLLLSFYISISGIGLIYVFLLKEKMTWLNASLIGLIFFISSQTYPDALLMVFCWFLLIFIFKLLPKIRNVRNWAFSVHLFFYRKNIALIIAFLIPMLFSVPYFFSYYANNIVGVRFPIVTSTLNLVSTLTSEIVKTQISFDWLFDIPALWLFFSGFGKLLALASFSVILLVILFIPRVSGKIASVFPSKEFANSLLLIYIFMLVIMSYLALTLFLPINLFSNLFDPARVWQHIFIPGTIMTAVVIFSAIYFGYLAFKRLFYDDRTNLTKLSKLSKNRILACAVLALLIFNVGLLSIPVITEQQVVYNNVRLSFNTYETLNQDDLSLMKWITENVPSQANILVSAGDSGQFVSSITQRQTISHYSYVANFSYLVTLLTSNSSDLRAVPLLLEHNISYVYIGSTATTYALQTPYFRHFNSTQFLTTPYFTLAKEVGDAWLFQFNASTALATYEAAGPLPAFVDQWHPSTYVNILASEVGYTNPPAGIYYGSGRLSVYAFANESYKLDHWMLNGSYLAGPENPVNVDYGNWNIQPVFTKIT